MTTRLVYIDRSLCDLAEPDRLAWQQWLARMGVDPMMVPVETELVISDGDRRIVWDGWMLDDRGRAVLTPDRQDLERCVYSVQLEAPALPVPPGFRVEVVT